MTADIPRRQSPAMSLVEAITNVLAGYVLALLTQLAVFPMFGWLFQSATTS
jgi:hypothetical protein